MSATTNRIIPPLIVVFVLVTAAPTFAGQIIYVDDDGPADFDNIQAAIDDSNDGDIIIVAEGRYFENINFNGRNITLTSNDPFNPDVVAATIIDGNQNGSVVTFNSGEDANCVLNGFTITNGNAERGGGIYCGWESNPTITNCTFNGNSAGSGGGMYNINSSPTLINCTFTNNSAVVSEGWGDGGGMANAFSSPTLTNCTFNENSASSGGGMCNQVIFDGECSPMLTNCTFSNNSAVVGGGMHSVGYPWSESKSSPTLTNCTFSENSASGSGGGMCNGYCSPTITNCTFSDNSAESGGGMCNIEGGPTLTNCTFTNNSAVGSGMWWVGGGGMFNFKSSPTIINCTLKENSAESGGGMYNISHRGDSRPTLTDCIFSENSAIYGGGMCNYRSSPIMANCTFSTNCAEFQEGLISYPHLYGLGGGMYNMGSNPTVTNCMFSGNAAEYHHGKGGGMYNAYSNSIVANCTFSGNTAGSHQHGGGGGMYNEEGYYTTVTNCIFWGNGSYGISGSSVDATYSDIEGGWPGEGNIDADPCFVDLGYWDTNDTPYEPRDDVWIEGDYHLLPGSPCINAGDPNHLFDPNETDLDGKPRVIGCRIDMGAYEYGQLVPSEVKIVPRTINLQSKGKWITCYIWPPEEYDVVEIDSNSILLKCKIEPEFLHVDEQEQVAIARFDREEVQAILYVGQIELIITGKLTDGTTFEATDIIKVTDKAGK